MAVPIRYPSILNACPISPMPASLAAIKLHIPIGESLVKKRWRLALKLNSLNGVVFDFPVCFGQNPSKNFQPPRIPLITFLSEILMMLIILLVYCCGFMIFKFSCSNKKYNFLASQCPLEFDKFIYLIQSEKEISYLNFKKCQAKLSSFFCTPRNLNSLMPCLSRPW